MFAFETVFQRHPASDALLEFAETEIWHSAFRGYADVEDPEIVVSVLVEEGGSGGSAAAPIARAVFDAYYGEE